MSLRTILNEVLLYEQYKRIDENYSPRTAISPLLIREDLSEKTSLGSELAGGEMVSLCLLGWWRDSVVARLPDL